MYKLDVILMILNNNRKEMDVILMISMILKNNKKELDVMVMDMVYLFSLHISHYHMSF